MTTGVIAGNTGFMVEKAILIVLVAVALIAGLSTVNEQFHKMSDKAGCALDGARVCVLDKVPEL